MRNLYKVNRLLIALVWLANGLVCKLLNYVPRHQQIVARVLQVPHVRSWTILIGLAECMMALWIFSGIGSRLNTGVQCILILAMNLLELIMARDLLLWHHWNMLFAMLFIVFILINEFLIHPEPSDR